MKGYAIYRLLKAFCDDPEGFLSVVVWLVSAAIEAAIVAVIVAGIAKLVSEKNDFSEWFSGSFVVFGIIEIILGIIAAIAG